ncbi:phosphotransferase [Bordetella sp. FB-8]|uniref:phosphotransferase n=1 Tax=Bordetella sp. FB-8 TaxID=1159870 RepID=UPI000526FDBA|nr:phosphotransferase [Bordetella sp. FB-8]
MTGPATAFDALPEAAVLSAPPAPVDAGQAAALLRSLYGLQGSLQALSGDRDANFLVTPASAAAQRWVLKISHPVEAAQVADLQTQALLHLRRHAPDLPVQRLHPTLAGGHSALPRIGGAPRVVRLLSYLEGLPMPKAPRSPRQAAAIAQVLARLDMALAGLPTHAASAHRLPWDIQHTEGVRSLTDLLGTAQRQALAGHALDRFAHCVKPRLPALRRQAIHNDFNPFNLLVDPDEPDTVRGILDFGDMVQGPTIQDVAVAASYHIDAEGDTLQAIAAFAAAYHAVHPLRPEELDLLLDLIRARLAMIVCVGGWRAARDPSNAEYVLRNNAVSWTRLAACRDIDQTWARDALRAACPCANNVLDRPRAP